MLNLSTALIEAMGYSKHPPDDVLKVKFGILKIYALQGIVFENNDEVMQSNIFVFDTCKVVVSQFINEASKLLLGDALTDNEEEWLLEKKAKPPFVVLYFNDDTEHVLSGGFRQKEGENIITYDAFPNGNMGIANWEKSTLPNIVTALTVHFSTSDRFVKLVPIDTRIFGETDNNQTLFNLKFTVNGYGYASTSKKIDEINSSLQDSVNLFSNLNEKLSRHIFMALGESDRLKQFLYFFLFIETYTNRQYVLLNTKQKKPYKTLENQNKIKEEGGELFCKFRCCKISVWKHLNDEDIESFKEMKKIRNDISHGEDIEESKLPVEKIQRLALKLLRTKES